MHILITLLVGAFVGWLAGKIMNCEGSWIRNIIIGVLGGAVSGFIFNSHGWLWGILCAVLCSCLLIWISKKIFK